MPEEIFTHADPNARSEDPDYNFGNEPDTGNRLPLPLTSGEVGKRTKTESISGSRANSMVKWLKKLQGIVDQIVGLTGVIMGPFLGGTALDAGLHKKLSGLVMEGDASVNYLSTLTKTLQEGGTWPYFLLLRGKFENLKQFLAPMLQQKEPEKPKQEPDPFDVRTLEAFHVNSTGGYDKYKPSKKPYDGIRIYIDAKDALKMHTHTVPYEHVGPGIVEPYLFEANAQEDEIVFYTARHTKRDRHEWVIGLNQMGEFQRDIALYSSLALKLMPGSKNVEGSPQEPKEATHAPSVMEQENTGMAPWQHSKKPEGLASPSIKGAIADEVLVGLNPFSPHGGAAAMNLYNSSQRIFIYNQAAKQLSQSLLGEVNARLIDPSVAKCEAHEGRNRILETTRSRLSPAARMGSIAMKEEGRSLAYMEGKTVVDLLKQYTGEIKGKGKFNKKTAAEIQAALDAESPLWKKHAAARFESEGARAVTTKAAVEDLRSMGLTSEAIIESAGRSRSSVTFVAKMGVVGGTAATAVQLAQLSVDIVTAEEGQKFHAAAQGLAGFAGGVVGGEVAVGLVAWAVSALEIASLENPVIFFAITFVAGMAGSAVGADLGPNALELAAGAGEAAMEFANPSTFAATKGGLAGIQKADEHERLARGGWTIQTRVEDAIWALDEKVRELEDHINVADSREHLTQLQLERLELLEQRAPLERALTMMREGTFDYGPDQGDSP